MNRLTFKIQHLSQTEVNRFIQSLSLPAESVIERTERKDRYLDVYSDNGKFLNQVAKKIAVLNPDIQSDLSSIQLSYPSAERRWIKFISGWKVVCLTSADTAVRNHRNTLSLVGESSFGIGSHATTQLCAEWIQKYAKRAQRFLDIGSGSGVLVIFASKLGVGTSRGIEIDPSSYRTSKKNIQLNRVKNCKVTLGGIRQRRKAQRKFDLVCANLESRFQESLQAEIKSWVKSGGYLILSGMIHKNLKGVKQLYVKNGFLLVGQKSKGEWTSVVFQRL